MIGYVTIGALDFETALPFYDAVFGAIGGERKSFEGGWAFYGPKDGDGAVGNRHVIEQRREIGLVDPELALHRL